MEPTGASGAIGGTGPTGATGTISKVYGGMRIEGQPTFNPDDIITMVKSSNTLKNTTVSGSKLIVSEDGIYLVNWGCALIIDSTNNGPSGIMLHMDTPTTSIGQYTIQLFHEGSDSRITYTLSNSLVLYVQADDLLYLTLLGAFSADVLYPYLTAVKIDN
jgi:hypothetical protein